MKKEKLVPEIRFKGFEQYWHISKLRNISDIYDGIHETPKYTKNGIMFLSVEDIATLKSNKYISYHDFCKLYKKYPQKGDVLMTRIGDVGTTNVVCDNSLKAYYVSLALIKPYVDSHYLNQLLKTQAAQQELLSKTLTTAVPQKINKNQIGEILLFYSTSKEEQQKIGQFFSNIDSFIQSEELKLKKLNEVKQSFLSKMFASENSKFPEIRFKGFDEPWKLNKFSDLYNCNNEKNINIRYTEKNIISVANMYFKDEQKISNTEYLKSYNIFHLGDIAYEGNKSANYRYGRFVVNTIGSGIVSHVFEVFKPVMKEYDLYFWKYYINNESIMRNVLRDSTKSTTMMATLVKKDLSNQFIKTTSIAEQQKIGAFFSNLESLISSQELKLEKLNNVKQALLEKMFC
ncbi:hypothetical protein [Mycoplasma sp. VS509_3]|uniref:hypothetical protein n=1 Tax=unclassified Mycoplasma TaxID=2683645 RepID=UPI003AAE8622